MSADGNIFFNRVGSNLDYSLAYAFGVLANLSYFPNLDYDDQWAQAFGFTDFETVVTPGPELPNYTRISRPGQAIFGIAGTVNVLQMLDNVLYCGQVHDNSFAGGYVHSYFRFCALGLIPFIDANLAGRTPGQTKLAFCGHSLGGAVAHLLSWHYALRGWDVRNCVIFNAPKPGNKEFATFSRPFGFWHVVNAYDKVSGLPPIATLEITNGFPLYGLIGNAWWHADPMFQIVVPESSDDGAVSVPSSRQAGIFDWRFFLGSGVAFGPTAKELSEARRGFADKWGRRAGIYMCGAALYYINKNNHRLDRLLNEIRNLHRGAGGALNIGDVIRLQGFLDTQEFEVANPDPVSRDFGLFDPIPFMNPNPPDSPSSPPPPSTPGTRIGLNVFTADVVPPITDRTQIDNITTRAAVVPSGADVPNYVSTPRQHWVFRGQDRRLLLQLLKLIDAIDRRDAIAWEAADTSRLSTREQIVDWTDDDQLEDWATVRDQVAALLALTHDD